MAVRYREPAWKKMVEDFLNKRKDKIQSLISLYNIPQVLEDGSVLIGKEKFARTKN